ncbi:MAG: 16S rRNA (guanine(966)-N(2))-methyltransferase RsmD [Myxococcota bacterium]
MAPRGIARYVADVRIIAGRFRGRRLVTPKHRRTRPTSDRVRESIFSILGDVDGNRVLDAYAGSGALGLEALSRGARSVDAVDRDRAAREAITANARALGVQEQLHFHVGDTVRLLLTKRLGGPYDLVFIDPPYASSLFEHTLAALATSAVVSEHGRIVGEFPTRAEPTLGSEWVLHTRKTYGDTSIVIAALDSERRGAQ